MRIILLWITLCCQAPLWAQGKGVDTDNILVISTGESPPFTSDFLPQQGRLARLIRAVFDEADLRVRFDFMPWPRAYHKSALGEVDATAYWYYKPEREQEHWHSEPLMRERGHWFYLKSKPLEWQSLEDLEGWRIGAIRGYTYTPEFYQAVADARLQVTFVNSAQQLLIMLIGGRIDTFVETPEVIDNISEGVLSSVQLASLDYHPQPLFVTTSHLLFPRKKPNSEALLRRFNQAMTRLRKRGRLDALLSDPL